MHQLRLYRVAVIVAGEMHDSMGRQELELQREGYTHTPRLSGGGVDGDHHLPEQAARRPWQLEGKGEDVGPTPDPAVGGIEGPNLGIIHDRDVDLARRAAERVERPLAGALDVIRGNPTTPLPIGDRDRHYAGSAVGAPWRRAS
jgi:hypothetical protein